MIWLAPAAERATVPAFLALGSRVTVSARRGGQAVDHDFLPAAGLGFRRMMRWLLVSAMRSSSGPATETEAGSKSWRGFSGGSGAGLAVAGEGEAVRAIEVDGLILWL